MNRNSKINSKKKLVIAETLNGEGTELYHDSRLIKTGSSTL